MPRARSLTRYSFVAAATLLAGTTIVSASVGKAGSGNNASADQPNWAEDVASVLHSNCVQCHSPGQSAPMSLRTYQEARPWAKSIGRNVESGAMPPWHASAGVGSYVNDRSLSPSDVETILGWVRAGAPAGDLADAPEPPPLPTGEWKLGEPDFVVTFEEVEIPADGPDQFRDLVGRVALPEDKWITAVEILPGNAKVVHHVITYRMKGFDFDPTQGWLGAWAAGTDPMIFPEGTGRLLPRGSNLIADMHYHPTGELERDSTRIGLHFADEPPAKELTNIWIMDTGFKIPAGAENHQVSASAKFWQDGKILGFAPHMHYRGKDFTYTAQYPDGRSEVLLRVDDYDFNWQTNYVLEEPISIPAGTVVEAVAHYDNSAANPDNPDPTIDVTFGDESYDEMMIGFVDFIVDEGVRPKTAFELRADMIPDLAARYPGAVYKVSGRKPAERDTPEAFAPLHLPREGDGVFYVIYDNTLTAAKVYDIVWDGNEFTAKIESPRSQPFDFVGTVEGDTIDTKLLIPRRDGEVQEVGFDGERVNS